MKCYLTYPTYNIYKEHYITNDYESLLKLLNSLDNYIEIKKITSVPMSKCSKSGVVKEMMIDNDFLVSHYDYDDVWWSHKFWGNNLVFAGPSIHVGFDRDNIKWCDFPGTLQQLQLETNRIKPNKRKDEKETGNEKS